MKPIKTQFNNGNHQKQKPKLVLWSVCVPPVLQRYREPLFLVSQSLLFVKLHISMILSKNNVGSWRDYSVVKAFATQARRAKLPEPM